MELLVKISWMNLSGLLTIKNNFTLLLHKVVMILAYFHISQAHITNHNQHLLTTYFLLIEARYKLAQELTQLEDYKEPMSLIVIAHLIQQAMET